MAQSWAPVNAGSAHWSTVGTRYLLKNRAVEIAWTFGAHPTLIVRNKWDGTVRDFAMEPFQISLASDQNLRPPTLKVASSPRFERIASERGALSKALRTRGIALTATWTDPESGLEVAWKCILRDGANYVTSVVSLTPETKDVDAKRIVLINLPGIAAKVDGSVRGSPLVLENDFFGLEHPMAHSEVNADAAISEMDRKLPLRKGQTTTYSAVLGVAPMGQLRRAFQSYVEQERARPYSPFLHYNSWYDLGEFGRYTADQCVERINTFSEELARKRGVKLSSFLFDDGWDNPDTTWDFNAGFPNQLTPLTQAAAKVGAGPGMWLSPCGGYGDPRDHRLVAAKKNGFETDSQGLALSGAKYYERFHQVCLDFVQKFGVNQFKFDGTGSPDKQFPGSRFDSDFDAAIQLIRDLRVAKPGLFINLTTGTWPSPFWTRYADSTWRGGYDHNFAGVGPSREKWITYRDGDTYNGVVKLGPLYPINSLMLHGLIYAQYADRLKDDPSGAFRHEVRSYFGSGTQLQEMYITPKLLSKQNWDDLAESAKWSRANAAVLRDVHWVGGDPLKLEVYGWGAWTPKKSTLVLRNPSDKLQYFSVDPAKVFELPLGAPGRYTFSTVYADQKMSAVTLTAGSSTEFSLAPFEVLTVEATPVLVRN